MYAALRPKELLAWRNSVRDALNNELTAAAAWMAEWREQFGGGSKRDTLPIRSARPRSRASKSK